jgi:hypothetical protein
MVGLIPTNRMADAIRMGMSNTVSLSHTGLDLLVVAVATVIVTGAVVWALRRARH